MRVLITGVAGFVGGHVVDLVRSEHAAAEVVGLDSRPGNRARALGIEVVPADLQDPASVRRALERVRPDRIVHLAAQSSPQRSWEDPAGTLTTNVLGLLHLLEGARSLSLAPRMVVVGSAEEYGLVRPEDNPLGEDHPLRPTSPYAVSKVAQGYLAFQYATSLHLPIVRTRTFHHTGPRRGEGFAESSFARQLAEIEAGRRPPRIEVGNLDTVRDFTDVRDVVRAYWALLERGTPGEVYNVCSGRGVRLADLLEELVSLSGLKVEIRVDPARLRPLDVPVLVGDPARLRAATGWEARTPLRKTLRDLLDHWRERVGLVPVPAPGA
ncbi:MAG TPA: GDP-mannose 4,6-dehydratase [Vicinamibacteria bacterium]|nr:GDP-mannose 4,6-dehydratase [Vicinamibacteria bacterium]